MKTPENRRIAVIGGGPAGMIAAATAAYGGLDVVLIERNEKLGKKLYLTGKGRCNITNSADMDTFMRSTLKNPRFLYSAFDAFTNKDIIKIINDNGVPTKTERGGRVFPVSDKSSDVLRALSEYVKKAGVTVRLNTRVASIKKTDDGYILSYYNANSSERFDALIIATGGVSYPQTGSTGDGFLFARELGHTINEPRPSLVQLNTRESCPKDLAGLTLKNVTLNAYRGKKRIYSELGEMLFTHNGVSGPLVLTLSGIIADAPEDIRLNIDLKPGLTHEQLDKRVLRDFSEYTRKQLKNALVDLLPSRLISVSIDLSGISETKLVDDITRKEREALVSTLKALPLTVKSTGGLDEAIVTRGGVSVREINPSTMESRISPGLYFSGEMIDVDAQTGGFNLQIAYSTGYLAGKSCAEALIYGEQRI